jgi:hypothetical protein
VLIFFTFSIYLFVWVSLKIFSAHYFPILIHHFLVKLIWFSYLLIRFIDLWRFAPENYFSVTVYSLKGQSNFVKNHSISLFSVHPFDLYFHAFEILLRSYHFEHFLTILLELIFSSRYFNKESLFLFCLDYLMESQDSNPIVIISLYGRFLFSDLLNFIENG